MFIMKQVSPPVRNNSKFRGGLFTDGGLDENNLSADEKLRRERSRERGLRVTQYEWVKTNSKQKTIMVPSPIGEINGEPELKVASVSTLPIIDTYMSLDGTMLAYVRDNELHVINLLLNESKQLTCGAYGNNTVHVVAEYIAQVNTTVKSFFSSMPANGPNMFSR